jgi:hypothetical protein
VIADLDATIANWLEQFLPDTDIVFDAPAGWTPAAGPAATTDRTLLWVFLHDIRQELDAGAAGWSSMRDDSGVVVGRMPPRRSYRLTYLLVPLVERTVDEHRLLGQVLAGALRHEVVAVHLLAGTMRGSEEPVLARVAPAAPSIDQQQFWAAWELAPRTSLELSVLAPMPPERMEPVAGPPSRVDVGAERLAPAQRPPARADDAPGRPRPVGRVTEP